MDQDSTQPPATSFAAQAYADLRAEVSLLRRAIERLTDERTSEPDYAPSLEALSKRLEDVCGWAKRISEQPAMRLTPTGLTSDIARAAAELRRPEQESLDQAMATIDAAAARIDGAIARSKSVTAQQSELRRNRIGFAVAGVILWSILPGAVARSLPVSWAVPEKMAARMLGSDSRQAGEAMMSGADPQRWSRTFGRAEDTKEPKRHVK